QMQGFGPHQNRLLSSLQRRVLNVQPKGTEDKHRLSPSGLRLLEMLEKFWNFRATRSPHNCYLVSKYQQPHKQTHYPCTGQCMSKPLSGQSPLSPHRAFVVQLTENMDAEHRLVHHAMILEFNVPSYRTRKRRRTDTDQGGSAAAG